MCISLKHADDSMSSSCNVDSKISHRNTERGLVILTSYHRFKGNHAGMLRIPFCSTLDTHSLPLSVSLDMSCLNIDLAYSSNMYDARGTMKRYLIAPQTHRLFCMEILYIYKSTFP